MKDPEPMEELTEEEALKVSGGPKRLYVGNLPYGTTSDSSSRSQDEDDSVIASDPGFGIVQSG